MNHPNPATALLDQLAPTVDSDTMTAVWEVTAGDQVLCGGEYRTVKEVMPVNRHRLVLFMDDGTQWSSTPTALRHVTKSGS